MTISIIVPSYSKDYTDLESFLAKYLRSIIPFVSRSVAALFNISRETDLNVPLTEVDLGFEGLLDGLPESAVGDCAVDLGSGIGDVCISIIVVAGEVGGVGRVSLSTASWFGVTEVDCGPVTECVSSDNMGNNESRDGVLPDKEGITFTKFPAVAKEGISP